MIDRLKSRKLWAAVLGTTIAAFGEQLGLGPDVIQWIAVTVSSYVLGQGIADAGANGGSQGE